MNRLPYKPGHWVWHSTEHEPGDPCDLSIGGCRYIPGVWLRLRNWLAQERWIRAEGR